MNDEIQHMVDQCWEDSIHFTKDGPVTESIFNYKKFSKLLVEECARRAEAYSYMSDNFNALAKELRGMVE